MPGSALTTDAPAARATLRGVIQWWGQLVAPRGQYASDTELIRARLLANMLSAMVIVGTPIVLYYMLRNPEIPITTDLWLAAGAIGVMLMLIMINRAGSTHAAALGFVSIITGLFVIGAFSDGSSIRFLFMSAVGLILTATFFPTRVLIVTLLVTLVAVVIMNTLIPRYDTRHVIDYCVFATLIAVASGVMVQHFHRLETARLDKLAAANAALRESESQLEKRVALRTEELRAAKEDAEAARDRSQRADRVKSQFLASMSHELRTPLNAILNFTEFVSMGMLGPVTAQQVDALTKSRDSARHLLALINDMLDITKIESGMLSLFVEENIDLRAELDTVIGSASVLIASKPTVAFVVDVDANLPPITGDRRRIRQALLNLLSNAAKFTDQGSITLSVKARGARILFAVIDTGPGIAIEDHDIIFEPFRQTVTGVQYAGGTGLGLPITLRLVEAHGGRLWLESEPGQGSAFYFELPVSNPSLITQARDNRATEKLL